LNQPIVLALGHDNYFSIHVEGNNEVDGTHLTLIRLQIINIFITPVLDITILTGRHYLSVVEEDVV